MPVTVTKENFDPRMKWSDYIPHNPTPKQHAFLYLDELEIQEALFGGQAGGGKSDSLLMAALKYVDIPGYAALILRQSYPDLAKPGAIMHRAKEWLRNSGAKWNENLKEFKFPSGSTLEFGYLRRDDDVFQFQSAEYQFIGFDELTQFTEFQYLYMRSRLRRLATSSIPIRVRSATNPGGKGHQWVRRRFISDKDPSRVFIPATLDDNPYLDRESYREQLEHLDPYTRAQLLHGDWSARPPGCWAFDHEHLDAVVKLGDSLDARFKQFKLEEPVGGNLHSGLDFGEATHILALWPRERGGIYVPVEHVYEHGEPDREADEWLRKVSRLGPYPLDRSRFDASKPESMRLFYRTLRERKGDNCGRPSPIPFNKYKRAAILHVRGMASRTAWGEVFGVLAISPTRCPILVEQLYDLQFKGEDTEDLVKKNDHGPDALFAGVAPEIRRFKPPEEFPPLRQRGEETRSVLSSG